MAEPRRKLPSLNALRAFEVAGRKLNFRMAADELFVSQSAVAQQVRALEEELGVTLFQRQSRGITLTAQGASYLADVARAFELLSESTGRLLTRSEAVTISVTPTVATKLLMPRLAEFNQALPDVELRTLATEALSDFDRDQVDIAVRLTRPSFAAALEAKLLFRQELLAVASPQLSKRLRLPLGLEQLRQLPLLHDSNDHWPLVLKSKQALQGAKFNQTSLALDAAMAGQGVALACRPFVAADLAAGRLVQVMDTRITTEPSYYLVRKRSATPRKAVDAVWAWCAERLVASST